MNTVHVKIESWDEDSKSLICRFASDTTSSNNPDSYVSLAYQPHLMWPDVSDSTELLRKIAQAGMSVCNEIVSTESINSDEAKKAVYSSLAGTSQSFTVSSLQDPITSDSTDATQ